MANRNALDAYIVATQNALDAVELVKQYIEDHGGILPDDVDWANVGTMNHLDFLLREALAGLYDVSELHGA